MPTIKEILEVHLSQLETTLRESQLLLQREGGLDGELRTSGSICERFIHETLAKFIIPGHMRLTSGFVATPDLMRANANLPQCDLLIVARDSLPLFRFEDSGIEVVPRESVCGIIEVKRSLTKQSLLGKDGSLKHLASIVESFGETSTFKTDIDPKLFNLGHGRHNYSSNKPLLGIVALQNSMEDFREVARWVTEQDSLVDFVWTLDGHSLVPVFKDGSTLIPYSHTARPESMTWNRLNVELFRSAPSPYYNMFSGQPTWNELIPGRASRSEVFASIIAIVSLMMSRVCARPVDERHVNEYYLR
jgi:hypothetical protein